MRGKTPDARRQTPNLFTLYSRSSPRQPNLSGLASGVWRLASLALVATACASSPAGTTTTTTVSTTTTATESWVWGVDSVDLGRGFILGPCDGDANQIACITSDGVVIGSAEFLVLPSESFDILGGVDDPVASIELIASDYISTFSADRQSTCPNLEFRELAPATVTVGGLPGLRYGFEELKGTAGVEKNLIYGVRVDDTIELFNFSAIADGACLSNEGEVTDPAILDSLLPGLNQVMAVVESG